MPDVPRPRGPAATSEFAAANSAAEAARDRSEEIQLQRDHSQVHREPLVVTAEAELQLLELLGVRPDN